MYEPREDSFLILKHVKDFCKQKAKVLDMGTGSGILAIEASRYSDDVTAVDIDKEVIKYLKKRIDVNKAHQTHINRYNRIKFIHSNLFSNLKSSKFDLIIFNPPYLPSKSNTYKHIDLDGGFHGTEIIEKFLKQAKQHLKKGKNPGKILLLTSSLNRNIFILFNKYKFKYNMLDQESFFFEKLYLWVLE
jgi:release factor glutamine methyltransferase